MSQLTMPLLVVNLGCEMLYILDQRLKAQSIPGDKSCKVLHDVVRTMFDSTYVEKLFAPQDMYTVSQTRKIFDRLAHSSIMRLSESSMDKLFDLMMMGFKYQLLCSTRVDQVQQVTLLHLSTIKSIIQLLPDHTTVMPLLDRVEELITATYKPLTMGQLHLLRQTLLLFFQDKRVKVSLFLQEGIQSSMGRIILPTPNSPAIGTMTTYHMAGGVESQEKAVMRASQADPQEFFVHPCVLGTNLYNKERNKVVPPPRKGDTITGPIKPEEDYKTTADEYADKGGGAGRKEFAYLSALLNMKPPATDNFKLNLFDNDDMGLMAATSKVTTATFNAGGKNDKHLSAVMRDMKVDDKAGAGADDGDSLLDLMDNA